MKQDDRVLVTVETEWQVLVYLFYSYLSNFNEHESLKDFVKTKSLESLYQGNLGLGMDFFISDIQVTLMWLIL